MSNVIVALAGNPNSGKSTMFNTLTGGRAHVANYPGVTVDTKEGVCSINGFEVGVVDLPGTYSLTAYSEEELVARNFLIDNKPTAVIDVINAGALERNLYLAVQLMEMGVPVILALNMMDEVRRQGIKIDVQRLSKKLDVPVVETVARSGEGCKELIAQAVSISENRDRKWTPLEISYGPDLDPVIGEMIEIIQKENFHPEKYPARWLALKYLEEDKELIALAATNPQLNEKLNKLAEGVRKHCKLTLNTSPEAIIADYRYGYIASLLKKGVIQRKNFEHSRVELSDKIDLVLTNAFFGPLIMAFVLYLMYKITFSLGKVPMSWVEGFFSYLGGRVEAYMPEGLLRSLLVSGIIDGVGGVLTFVPLIIIIFIMLSFLEDSGYIARMAYMLDRIFRIFGLHGCSVMPFIISGGIAGGCAVPGIMAARALRSPKERLATILTAPFMACGAKIPVFLMLVSAFFPENSALVMFLITMFAWAIALLTAKLLRSAVIKGESTPFVMELPPYRLPTLKGILIHTFDRAWSYVKKAGTVILAVAVLIWASMTFPGLPKIDAEKYDSSIKILKTEAESTYSQPLNETDKKDKIADLEEQIKNIENEKANANLRASLAGKIGIALETVSSHAGFDWRTNIALIGGFAAKEIIVATMGTVYSMGKIETEETEGLSKRLTQDPSWNKLKAISMIVFVLLYSPCFVTIVVMVRESSWKWAAFAMGFNTLLAYTLAVGIYQIGRLLIPA